MSEIEVYADVVCPFTHVGLRRLAAERTRRGSTRLLRVRAWPLEWVNGSPLDPEFVSHEISALRATVAPSLFRGFGADTFPKTSIPAFGLAAAAYAVGPQMGEVVSLALRDALFEAGRDISADDVLDDLAHRFGIERTSREVDEANVRADWERGRLQGVQGSPHFFLGEQNWFCPALEIKHVGDDFIISEREDASRFLADALG